MGRVAELAALHDALAASRAGAPRVVVVEGPAGIGKTALVRRAVSSSGGPPPWWANGDEAETRLPWGVLGQLARSGGTAGAIELTRLIEGLDTEADPLFVGAAVLRGLGDNDEQGVIVLDDAHLADRQSLDALSFVARRLSAERMLVVATQPSADGDCPGLQAHRLDPARTVVVRLGGLAPADLLPLSLAVTGRPLSPQGAARLHEHTGGHPLHARALLEQLPWSAFSRGVGPLPAPADLSGAVVARLAGCRADTRAFVAAAAVLGRTCAVRAAGEVAGLVDAVPALAGAVAAGLLVEVAGSGGSEVTFSHALVHAAVLHDLGVAQRRTLHVRATGVTRGEASLAHRVAAASGVDDELADALERQARADLRLGRTARAAERLREAMELTPPSPHRAPRLLVAVETLLLAGEVAATEPFVEELEALPPGPFTDYVAGYQALLSARLDVADARLRRAWAAIADGSAAEPGSPSDLAARIGSQLAIMAILRFSYSEMVELGQAAVAAGATTGAVAAFAWFARTVGLALSGRGGEALALLGDLARSGRAGGLDGLVARGMIRLWSDDLDGSFDDLTEALRRATAGEPLRVAQGLAYLGEVAYRRGALDEAVLHTELAVADATDHGRVWDFAMLHALAAYPRAARGDWREAEAHARTSAEWAELFGAGAARAYAAIARATIADARDDVPALIEAASDLGAVYDSLEPGTHLLGPALADGLVRAGRTGEAKAALAAFEGKARRAGRASAEAACDRVAGQIAAAEGDWLTATGCFSRAASRFAALGMPLEVAKVELAEARSALARERLEVAAVRLRSLLARADALGAAAFAATARALLVRHDLAEVETGAVADAPPDFARLTPTEAAIARLVGRRYGNKEVAARLFVSVKTVEYHLTHVYAKLGVASRLELARLFEASPAAF